MDGIRQLTGQNITPLPQNITSKEGAAAPARENPPTENRVKGSEKENALESLKDKISAALSYTDVSVGFTTYGDNRIAVVIYRKDTGEVIREIPPREIQELQLRLEEMIGLLFNARV